jgi:hypothetical protein
LNLLRLLFFEIWQDHALRLRPVFLTLLFEMGMNSEEIFVFYHVNVHMKGNKNTMAGVLRFKPEAFIL